MHWQMNVCTVSRCMVSGSRQAIRWSPVPCSTESFFLQVNRGWGPFLVAMQPAGEICLGRVPEDAGVRRCLHSYAEGNEKGLCRWLHIDRTEPLTVIAGLGVNDNGCEAALMGFPLHRKPICVACPVTGIR